MLCHNILTMAKILKFDNLIIFSILLANWQRFQQRNCKVLRMRFNKQIIHRYATAADK